MTTNAIHCRMFRVSPQTKNAYSKTGTGARAVNSAGRDDLPSAKALYTDRLAANVNSPMSRPYSDPPVQDWRNARPRIRHTRVPKAKVPSSTRLRSIGCCADQWYRIPRIPKTTAAANANQSYMSNVSLPDFQIS